MLLQSHPLRRMHVGQYQASSAMLGSLGDGNCYLNAVMWLALSMRQVEGLQT